jgi:DGQHR domain-containing protein
MINVPAIEIQQSPERTIYSFAIDGKVVPEFAAITRVKRGRGAKLFGYQRPEILSHIAEIRRYLESDAAMLPNAIVMAFTEKVEFRPVDPSDMSATRMGTLMIPAGAMSENGEKVGWVVDGQQRLAAIMQAARDTFPVVVNAFVAQDIEEQRTQFILVNSTKPLPQGLILELLPLTEGLLPTRWADKQRAAEISQWLNYRNESPFQGLIKTPTNPDGVIQDNSILRMINSSLKDGVLYDCADDDEAVFEILAKYWTAVKEEFPESWGVSPRKSRLMHGVGIVSMGCLMDMIAARKRDAERITVSGYRSEVALIADKCRWSAGVWDFGAGICRKWNDVQNTSRDVQMVSNYVLSAYRITRSSKTSIRDR